MTEPDRVTLAWVALCRTYIGHTVTVSIPGGRHERATLHAVTADGAVLEDEYGEIMLADPGEISVAFP